MASLPAEVNIPFMTILATEMPVWGDIFMEESLPKEVHPGVSAKDLVEARMLALTFYIMTLQQ